MVHNH